MVNVVFHEAAGPDLAGGMGGLAALPPGRIAGAGPDVCDTEPPPTDQIWCAVAASGGLVGDRHIKRLTRTHLLSIFPPLIGHMRVQCPFKDQANGQVEYRSD